MIVPLLAINPADVESRVTVGDLFVRVGDLPHALEQVHLAPGMIPEGSPLAGDLRSRIDDRERQLRR